MSTDERISKLEQSVERLQLALAAQHLARKQMQEAFDMKFRHLHEELEERYAMLDARLSLAMLRSRWPR